MKDMGRAVFAQRVVELENKKRERERAEEEGEEVPEMPVFAKSLSPVIEKEEQAEILETEAEELFLD